MFIAKCSCYMLCQLGVKQRAAILWHADKNTRPVRCEFKSQQSVNVSLVSFSKESFSLLLSTGWLIY